MNAPCAISDCNRPQRTRGWCDMHYKRWRKHGDPLVVKKIARSADPVCSIADCERPTHAKGMCAVHGGRLRHLGDPLAGGKIRMVGAPIADRFWSMVYVLDDEGACWPWIASVTPNGYGQFFMDGRLVAAHRVALELSTGVAVPELLDVDHVCHTDDPLCTDVPCAHRRCCNPLHLEAVTHQENVRRGRRSARTGVN